ncbi:hypothetical protein [Phyllobacterium myrsinacearum]|uniref:Uncharacterized protein n=1 Tax=Phyllobacterium myrsinacearum TaxID=28101 RepID=A0A839EIX9_9HYPH|nr:hypothetical protein [Phyllobacterium myrsinacearum]MBA8876457.1 hypothetical protein [Phyllobacterium myrsinacearum]
MRISRTYKNKIPPPWTRRAYDGREQDCLNALKERFNELAYSQDIHRLYMEAIASGWSLLDIISAVNFLVTMSGESQKETLSSKGGR